MTANHSSILEKIYQKTLASMNNACFTTSLSSQIVEDIDFLVSRSEGNKGVIAVLTTLLTHKIYDNNQDIRYHRKEFDTGFSARSIDTQYVTPFLKKVSFPAMAESGWLTRSFEQPYPYTLEYQGKITPKTVKISFLKIINEVQVNGFSAQYVLSYLFKKLIEQRDQQMIDLAKPHSLSIATIIKYLHLHFSHKYGFAGGSRLPTLALYAAYECMIKQLSRYENKILCPLESHTSSDAQSGRIGDIDINNTDNCTAFEGVEIKHEIIITPQIIRDAYEKFKIHNTDRYYILTTANMDTANWDEINDEIKRISQLHGCQVIVNGVYTTLNYYLRLLKDPSEFIANYVELIKIDTTVKFQHKETWNDIVSGKIV